MLISILYYTWLALFCLPVLGFNRSLFFRTSSFWDEPRFEKPYLGTLELQMLGGSNHKGRNGCPRTTNILSIYGTENVKSLSAVDPEHPLILPHNPKNISFQGIADVFEFDLNLYQNFCHGFFMHFHLPAILLQIHPSGYLEDPCCSQKTTKHYKPAWQHSLLPLNTFLDHFCLRACTKRDAGLSDSTLFLGWTYSYENTCYLDFIDFTAKTGVLIPSGKKADPHLLFDVPLGYNGHWGVPLSADVSVGIFDWVTMGLHADAVFFINRRSCVRMKAPGQKETGFIRLLQNKATVDQGAVWRVGTYVRSDHFFNGLSFLLGFSYEQQNRSWLRPCSLSIDESFVNNDERLKKWNRSIAHLSAEYDFGHSESCLGARIAFFYDIQMTGKRVFNINTLGGYLGFDMSWCY